MKSIRITAVLMALCASVALAQTPTYFKITSGAHPHDVAATVDADGLVYYTAQMTGNTASIMCFGWSDANPMAWPMI